MARRVGWCIGGALCVATLVACSSSGSQPAASPQPAQGSGVTPPPSAAGAGAPSAPRGSAGTYAVSAPAGGTPAGAGTFAAGSGGMAAVPVAGAAGRMAAMGGAAGSMKPMRTGPKTPYPGGSWTVPTASYGTTIDSDVQIKMSDGVVLIGDVSYPTDLKTGKRATGTFPVLLTQNPYGPVFGAASGELFVTHGYIFASIDVRGTSRSAGVHDMFAPREAEDGAALVAWAAKLEGGDGRVGLHGCSQLGINQLETVSKLGPDSPVKAMIPACGSGDFYRDTAFDNGIPTAVGDALVGTSSEAMQADMYLYRDYWKTRDRLARAPAMAATGIPMLLWSGWHEPGALGSLELYTALQNLTAGRPQSAKIAAGDALMGKYQVIIGDWSHAGGLDQGIQLQWFDTWIKGVDTGLPKDTATPLHLAELAGTKRWVNASTYPIVPKHTALFLAGGGKLLTAAEAAAGGDELKWVPPGQQSAAVEYTSEPFAKGAMLAGPLAARLQATSSNKNLQLVIEVLDRAADGKLALLSRGSVLGSLCRTDPDKSWTDENGLPMRPYLTLDEDQPLTAGTPTQLDVPLWPTLWSIEPGHSLVVRVSTQPRSDDCGELLGVPVGCNPTPAMQQSLSGGVYTLHRGGELKSLISLPLLEHGALETSESAVSPTGRVTDPTQQALGVTEYPLPIDW